MSSPPFTRLQQPPQIIPLFIGIALGVVVGSWPLSIPGLIAYATVYPLVMLLRVLSAQVLVLFLLR